MNILDLIMQAQGGGAVRQLGNQFGLAPEQTQSAITALVPALAPGLQRNMGSQGGKDPSSLGDEATTVDGNGILGHGFGSKDVSRAVAQRASDHEAWLRPNRNRLDLTSM